MPFRCRLYDTADYAERAGKLQADYARIDNALRNAWAKLTKDEKLARELLRGAEIKATASNDLRQRQAAAIAALKRLLTHFEDRS